MNVSVHINAILPDMDFLRSRHKAVLIAASAGGFGPMRQLLSALPSDFPSAVIVLQHTVPMNVYRSVLPQLLAINSGLQVKWAEHGEQLHNGIVYVSPQDVQTTITSALTFDLAPLDPEQLVRPAVDPLFCSAAESLGEDVIAVVLSGCLSDGAHGARRIADHGGRVFVQDEDSALFFDMPRASIKRGAVDFVLSPIAMAHALKAILMAPGADAWFRVDEGERLRLCAEC